MDGQSGHLIMSKKKLLFIHEEGFFHKKFDVALDLPYDKIGKVWHEGRYEIDLTEKDGKKHVFKAPEVPAKIIEKLGWKKGQKLKVEKKSKKIIIEKD